ncbi:glycoside hydrolase family 88 protein, partial [Paenibacillus sepulcri]|nr:glycoside hydrolase family 88 protein [Paenibacillus sepulcri]
MYIPLLCCLLLLAAVVLIILIDAIPIFADWLSRIRIGRYRDLKEWNESVTQRGAQWLNRTPKMKVTDNTRLVVIDMLQGNYTKNAIQHWQEAALLIGLSEYADKNQDRDIENEIRKYVKAKFDSGGNWVVKPRHIDGAIVAYAVMKQQCIDPDGFKPAFDYIWEFIQEHIGDDGTVMYRKSMKNYRYVDTIGFVCPFLVAYGLRYDKRECVELAVRQLVEYERHGMLDHHYLPSHAYHVDHKTPLGLYGWGRGLGWFAIGLMD